MGSENVRAYASVRPNEAEHEYTFQDSKHHRRSTTMRTLAILLLACVASGEADAQLRTLQTGVYGGPIVFTAEAGEDEIDYEGSVLVGVRVRRVEPNSGAFAEIGYTLGNVTASRDERDPTVPDTLNVRMVDIGVGYEAERGAVRFAPVIGVGIYRFEDPTRGFVTTGFRAEFTPSPGAGIRPWFGVEGKYYGLRPFVDDGLYLVYVTASLDFTRAGRR